MANESGEGEKPKPIEAAEMPRQQPLTRASNSDDGLLYFRESNKIGRLERPVPKDKETK